MGGVDKPLLPLGGGTVLDALLQRLAPQVGSLAISANGDPARYAGFGLLVLADDVPDQGPLGGVARGLAWAAGLGASALLTVPGDTPFIPEDLVARLSSAPAWAASGGAVHPLVALWPVAAGPALAAWLAEGHTRRVRAFGEAVGMRTVAFDDQPDPFCNINTPADLLAAQSRAAALPAT
jgi:molybdenum cofactor guanylyltransferase